MVKSAANVLTEMEIDNNFGVTHKCSDFSVHCLNAYRGHVYMYLVILVCTT